MDFELILKDHPEMAGLLAQMQAVQEIFGKDKRKAVPVFEEASRYNQEEVAHLFALQAGIMMEADEEKCQEMISIFNTLLDSMTLTNEENEKIYLWDEKNIPKETEYTVFGNTQYNHDPDFQPFMVESLIDENETPKGAVVICAGGDHGDCVFYEGYKVAEQLNELGYQCFVLANRPNMNPWSAKEAGADVARAIRIIRANADKYRINEEQVAYAGFSNGGLTGEANIQNYSGQQKISDHFPAYQEDEIDKFYGAPDIFLNIYGPRFVGNEFDYSKVLYPPTFMAEGKDDFGMVNFNFAVADLIAHDVELELHTFAGTPHGVAGKSRLNTGENYQAFDLWLPLADNFMQCIYKKNRG